MMTRRKAIGLVIFCIILGYSYINSTIWLRLKLVNHYLKIKDYKAVIAIYQNILRKGIVSDPRYRTSPVYNNIKSNLLETYKNLKFKEPYLIQAEDYLSRGLLDKAISSYQKIIDINDDYETALAKYNLLGYEDEDWHKIIARTNFGLGIICLQRNEWYKAVIELKKITALESDFNNIGYSLDFKNSDDYKKSGIIFIHTGFPQHALKQFQIVNKLEPRDAEAYYFLGKCLDKLGRKHAAESAFKESIKLEEDTLKSVPGNLVSLKRLNELYLRINNLNEAKIIQLKLDIMISNKKIVAEMLKINEKGFTLGKNLISNGDFEIGDIKPLDWTWINWTNDIFNKSTYYSQEASFLGSLDIFEQFNGDKSLKILGVESKGTLKNKIIARAGFYAKKVTLKSNTPYVLSFYYKTKDLKERQAAVWIGGDSSVIFPNDCLLPDTDGYWRKFLIVGWNKKARSIEIEPLVRSYGMGEVWFDGVALEELIINPGIKLTNNATQFILR